MNVATDTPYDDIILLVLLPLTTRKRPLIGPVPGLISFPCLGQDAKKSGQLEL